MEVKVDLGLAAEFLRFDSTTNSFKVASTIDLSIYCGAFEICVQIFFKNATYIEQYSDCFVITIECPEEPIPPFEFPILDPANFTIHEGPLELGPYNPDQPIPRIKDLTPTGILLIGWDRQMTPPEDFTEINPSKVGIRDKEAKKFDRTPDPPPDVIKTDNDLSISSIDPNNQRRQLDRGYDWFEIEKHKLEWLMVVDALELKMKPGEYSDPLVLDLKWEMLDFNKENIWI